MRTRSTRVLPVIAIIVTMAATPAAGDLRQGLRQNPLTSITGLRCRFSITTSVLDPEDEEVERSLRPRRLDDFVGQDRIREQLGIALGRELDLWGRLI